LGTTSGLTRFSISDFPHLAWFHFAEHLEQGRNQGPKVGKPVGWCAEQHKGNGTVSEALLETHALVDVTRTSNSPAITSRSRPFVRFAQPRSITLATSWP
jgi:hypothetical protein